MTTDSPTGWTCPVCGPRTCLQVQLDGRDRASFNPCVAALTPRCRRCERPLTYDTNSPRVGNAGEEWGRVLVIGGPCASGKTSVSHELATRHGFVQIDGDWIIWQLKAELGRAASFAETHTRALALAEVIVALGRDVALAHVVLPDAVSLYEGFLRQRRIDYAIVILMPTPVVAQERNVSRPCWTTPDEWMDRFYSDYASAPDDAKALYHDSSSETVEETAQYALGLLPRKPAREVG